MLDKKKMEDAFNDQINKELYSEYLYLAMKAIFADLNLPGFVNWFDVQVQEEKELMQWVCLIMYLKEMVV